MTIDNKHIKALVVSTACTFVTGVIMLVLQTISSNSVENSLADKLLSEIPRQLDTETAERKEQIREFDLSFLTDLTAQKYVMSTCGQNVYFHKLKEKDLADAYFLVCKDGMILNGTDDECIGEKFTDIYPLSPDEYALIVEGDDDVSTGVHVTDDGRLFKVYAISYNKYRFVTAAVLKGEYASVYSLDNMDGVFGLLDERLFITTIDNKTLELGKFKAYAADLAEQDISVLNLDKSVTLAPSSGHSRAMGYGFDYRTVQYESEIFGSISILAIRLDEGAVQIVPLIIFLATILILTFLLQLYGNYIDDEPGKLQLRLSRLRPLGKKGLVIDAEKARILMPFSMLGIVIATFVGIYLNSLYRVAAQVWTSRWNIEQVSDGLSMVEKTFSDNTYAVTEDMVEFLQITSSVLEERQKSLLDCRDDDRLKNVRSSDGATRIVEIRNPWLAGLSEVETASDISIFDSEGNLVSTSGTQRNLAFSRENAATAPAFDVIDGVSTGVQFIAGEHFIVAVPFSLSKNGETCDAMLVLRFPKEIIQSHSIYDSIIETFEEASESGHVHYTMVATTPDHKPIYSPKALFADNPDLQDAAYSDGYIGFHKINGDKYFVATKRASGHKNDYYISSYVPFSEVNQGRWAGIFISFGVTMLVILALLAIMLVYGSDRTARLMSQVHNDNEARKSMTPVQLEKLEVERKKTPSASQKIMKTMRKVWLLVMIFASLEFIIGVFIDPVESFAGYLMSFTWQRGINLFSITSMLIIVLSFSLAIYILTKSMSVLGNALNANAETACQLLLSLLRYSGYIVAVFVTLYMFGVDTTGVLASLGAFSVMVGLGAKNLITDILAGISIILEKDYRVGDIVNIGGFCGKVNEIGIRTTKVEDIDGNVKIFYNSAVGGVINMTCRPSVVKMDLSINAEHSFVQVEEEFYAFFERIAGKYPQIKGECTYLGVQDCKPTFNVYRIVIPCEEIDRVPLRRALTKEFSEFCKERNITKL